MVSVCEEGLPDLGKSGPAWGAGRVGEEPSFLMFASVVLSVMVSFMVAVLISATQSFCRDI